MRSRDARPADLEVVVEWVTSRQECELWAGPGISFPLAPRAFSAQIDMRGATNVALDDEGGLAAFGQVLRRSPGRAHLARLIVRPDARRRGIGRALVQELEGFVYPDSRCRAVILMDQPAQSIDADDASIAPVASGDCGRACR